MGSATRRDYKTSKTCVYSGSRGRACLMKISRELSSASTPLSSRHGLDTAQQRLDPFRGAERRYAVPRGTEPRSAALKEIRLYMQFCFVEHVVTTNFLFL